MRDFDLMILFLTLINKSPAKWSAWCKRFICKVMQTYKGPNRFKRDFKKNEHPVLDCQACFWEAACHINYIKSNAQNVSGSGSVRINGFFQS